MKRIILVVVVLVLGMMAIAPVMAEQIDSRDGVDWTPIELDALKNELTNYLGYEPIMKTELLQDYGVLTIQFPEEGIQKMLRIDENENIYMSYRDYVNLTSGELSDFISRVAKTWLVMYPNRDDEGNIVNYQYEDIICFYDLSGALFMEMETGATEMIHEVVDFRALSGDRIIVPGRVVAQTAYDAKMMWATR